jgi:hypothetical protein
MDAVTYPDPRTVEFLRRHMVLFRADSNRSQALFAGFHIQYTPTEIVLDGEGREHHRSVGFLPPQEFIPQLMLGIAKALYDNNDPSRSLTMLQRLLSEFPGSRAAGESVSLRKACLERGGRAS